MIGESKLMKFKIGDIVYLPRLKATGIVFELVTERIIGIQFFDPDPNKLQRYFGVHQENLKVLS
jgi:hypothetical protein